MSKRHLSDLRRLFGGGIGYRDLQLENDGLLKLALQNEIRRVKQRVLKKSGGRHPNPRVRAAAKRHAADQAKKLRRRLIDRPRDIPRMGALVRKFTPSRILDRLDPERPEKWRPLIARGYRSEYPRLALGPLNFLDDPIATIEQFKRLSEIERSEVNAFLDFADPRCMDVGAYLVLAEIWPQMSPIFRGGVMSMAVQKVLSAMELDRDLGIGLPNVTDHQYVSAFPIARRRPGATSTDPDRQLKPADREKMADKLVELVNGWLIIAAHHKDLDTVMELSDQGKSLIGRMVGEILCNAERHSLPDSDDGDWSMSAFMAARDTSSGEQALHCYLGFLNSGQSIAESMSSAPEDMLRKTERYTRQFSRKRVSKDLLTTVVALQDTVTSNSAAVRGERGGTGLQDVLEFAAELGACGMAGSDVRVTIVSGTSCIRLKSPILAGVTNQEGRRVQWCNRANQPDLEPDPTVAFELPAHFAGTLVSVGFILDPHLLTPKEEELDG